MRFGAVFYLRSAAVLTFLHGLGHTIGGVFGAPAPGAQAATVNLMKLNRFDAMGVSRTYWDFHLGYGLFVSVSFLLQAVLFWQLSSLINTNPRATRPILATFAVGYLLFAALAWQYFFPAAVIFEVVIAGCLFAAFFVSRPARPA